MTTTLAPPPAATRTCAVLDREAPATARRHTRQALHRWHLTDPLADTVELVVSELVTNSHVHGAVARPSLALTLQSNAVLIEVLDGGGRLAAPLHDEVLPEPDAETGRGLPIVAALAAEHGLNWARIAWG